MNKALLIHTIVRSPVFHGQNFAQFNISIYFMVSLMNMLNDQ